jgi:hypothetical protein
MVVRGALLLLAFSSAPHGAPQSDAKPFFSSPSPEPQLQLGKNNFALPVIDYRAPGGTWKRSSGIVVGHDISPNAAVGLGFFKMKPKFQDPANPPLPSAGKSKKVSLGFSLRF